jgi:hypothetical protein
MKKNHLSFTQKLRRIVQPPVRSSAYQHDPLLIVNLIDFNFRPPRILEFPGERLARRGAIAR